MGIAVAKILLVHFNTLYALFMFSLKVKYYIEIFQTALPNPRV